MQGADEEICNDDGPDFYALLAACMIPGYVMFFRGKARQGKARLGSDAGADQ